MDIICIGKLVKTQSIFQGIISMASEERFGYEWKKYSTILPDYEGQFQNWISPLKPEDLQGYDILDAGCGMGRNSYFALKYGAKSVMGIDNDERSVSVAKENLTEFDNATINLKSIYELDYKNKFDIIFSIGVIHHLKYPELAIKKLVGALRPRGTILIWVYSYEGNEWIQNIITPIRRVITSKLPISLLHYITYILSIPFFLCLKLFKSEHPYYKQISKFSLGHLHSIIFDQLLPEIAHYWTKEEAYSLFKKNNLRAVSIHKPPNEMGWTMIGRK